MHGKMLLLRRSSILSLISCSLLCQNVACESEKIKELYKQMATGQRNKLQDLYRMKNRPNLLRDLDSELFVISREVLDRWRAFVR